MESEVFGLGESLRGDMFVLKLFDYFFQSSGQILIPIYHGESNLNLSNLRIIRRLD